MCFIGLICCLTSLSPSLILLMLSALPRASLYPSTSCSPSPSPSPSPFPFPRKCTRTRQYPPTACHPSLSLTSHHSSCVSACAVEAHYEPIQCQASPVRPFLFDTCAAAESFACLIYPLLSLARDE